VSLRTDIQGVLRGVPALLGETTWYYRRLTSGPVADPRTYGSWTAATVHASARTWVEQYDDSGKSHGRVEQQQVRQSDAVADLKPGDQFKDPDAVEWAITAIASSGVGTKAYTIQRQKNLKAGPDRGEAV
jgi:hypothetical protein